MHESTSSNSCIPNSSLTAPFDHPISDDEVKSLLKHENNSLRLELAELKKELDEIQDSFRTKDAEEFQRMQLELEMANKKCRVLQYRLMRVEKRNDELVEEKARLEECLSLAQEQLYKLEELEDELVIAKEVSVRLHKELEESEELRNTCEQLNQNLKDRYEELKEHIGNLNQNVYSDCNENKLFFDLYDSLYREYALNEKLSKQSQEIKVLQTKQGASRYEVDQKLTLMHGYVCRLREAIEEKDGIIRALTEKQLASVDHENKVEGINDEFIKTDGKSTKLNLACSQSTPDLNISVQEVHTADNQPTIASVPSASRQVNRNSRLLLWRSATTSTLAHEQSTTLMPSHGLTDAFVQCNLPVDVSEGGRSEDPNATPHERKENRIVGGLMKNELNQGSGVVEEKRSLDLPSSQSGPDRVVEITKLRAQIRQQAEEIENMRRCFNDYLKLKQDLETSLQEAGELIISKDSFIAKIREESSKMQLQFNAEQNCLIEQVRSLNEELQNCYKDKVDVEKRHAEQLRELKELEDSYHSLGQRLNYEVSELTKQIAQLNEDKEKLESSFDKLHESKKIQAQKDAANQTYSTIGVQHESQFNTKSTTTTTTITTSDNEVTAVALCANGPKTSVALRGEKCQDITLSQQRTSIPLPTKIGTTAKSISRSFYNGNRISPVSSPETSMSQSVPLASISSTTKTNSSQGERVTRTFNRSISATGCDVKVQAYPTTTKLRQGTDQHESDQQNQSLNRANKASNIFTRIRYHRRSKSRVPTAESATCPVENRGNKLTESERKLKGPSNIPKPVSRSTKVSEDSNRSGPKSRLEKQPSRISLTKNKTTFAAGDCSNSSSTDNKHSVTSVPDNSGQSEATDKRLETTDLATTVNDVDSLLSRVTSTARPLMIDS
ncbi:hypothetical protein ACOME3_008719 [Neoechinorhynchus agilis]